MDINNAMWNDAYNTYYIVCESDMPEDSKIDILKCEDSNKCNYVRFKTNLQTFRGRNRNRRLWKGQHVKLMSQAEEVQELIRNNSFVGEAGHPIPDSGPVTMERIVTLEPLRCSHRITELIWTGDDKLDGIVETLDEGVGSPGYRFFKNIMQGIIPAFSLRSVVPQRKNPDGSIDVLGPGRMICYDRVYLPSHKEAYMDKSVPVKQVCTQTKFETVMESYCGFITSHSDKIRRVVDEFEPAMENAYYDINTDMVTIPTKEGRVFVRPELKYRKEMKGLYRDFF